MPKRLAGQRTVYHASLFVLLNQDEVSFGGYGN
jgi:hypothetical protein